MPLTLAEAMAQRVVQVRETGNVNSLEIENLGDQDVFVQAGDIVKGGQQDRTLTVSLLLPPKSGRIPIASFCVEHGRWSARAGEDVRTFSTSAVTVSSREMKLAMQAPAPATAGSGAMDTNDRQQKVWDGVQREQKKLSAATGANVSAPASATSLQLALENKKLAETRNAYVAVLKPAGEHGDDIVGYVFAVNGKINSAEIYASNGLFRKMWPKMLDASATEAIGQKAREQGRGPAGRCRDGVSRRRRWRAGQRKAAQFRGAARDTRNRQGRHVRNRAGRRRLGASQLSREVILAFPLPALRGEGTVRRALVRLPMQL